MEIDFDNRLKNKIDFNREIDLKIDSEIDFKKGKSILIIDFKKWKSILIIDLKRKSIKNRF
jgi:hypothetical protein